MPRRLRDRTKVSGRHAWRTSEGALCSALLRVFGSLLLCAACTGCFAISGHENFLRVMQWHVGKRIDDPNTPRNRYPGIPLPSTVLPNGDVEEQWVFQRKGFDILCRVYFRVDSKSQRIISYRYEGSPYDCYLRP
jgi:hypothetical protein